MGAKYLFLVSEVFLKEVPSNTRGRHKGVLYDKSIMNYIIRSWFCLL